MSFVAALVHEHQWDPKILIPATSLISYLVFKRFEPDTFVPLVALLGLVPGALALLLRGSYVSLLNGVLVVYASYFSLILFYVTAYRLSPLHPLAKYPGPVMTKLSKFYLIWVTSRGKQHIFYQSLHKKYGDVVRVGPNELSFCIADAVDPIMGTPGLPKGPYWDGRGETSHSLVALRSPAEHARRRKPWNRAFASAALKDYQEIVIQKSRELIGVLSSRRSEVVDLSIWMSYFSFDFMGEMAFGFDFGLVRQGNDPMGMFGLIQQGLEFDNTISHTPWMAAFSKRLPGPARNARRLQEFVKISVERRIDAGSTKRDIFYHLMDEEGLEPVKPSRRDVISDGALAIIAGSDTTATTLAALWHYLLPDAVAHKRLKVEIDAAFPEGLEPVDTAKLASMPFLNACINEALRLLPPIPGGVQRWVPRGTGGKMIGSHFASEGTNLFVHFWSLHRNPDNFSRPDEFIPDRWLAVQDRSEKFAHDLGIHNAAAFVPFSAGPAGCAGKNLALMEIRSIVCFIMQKFDITIADADAFRVWEDNLEDWFTVKRGPLPVTLKARF
ncbi:hypothetical protein PLICRDRAFT_54227 [Plicaturopsis crispa FD-325 SS-3]|nr:hypothetical protein PLICRDRAFT_54227 [Plicaturopsis crispa FD-325 SS-3]